MRENYLMLNGKRIDLTEEQVKTLTEEEKKSPFERVEKSSSVPDMTWALLTE